MEYLTERRVVETWVGKVYFLLIYFQKNLNESIEVNE